MLDDFADSIKELLKKLYPCWLLADMLTFLLFLLMSLTGGWTATLTDLLIALVVGAFPFPFNMLIAWILGPFPVVAQVVLFVVCLIAKYGKHS